MAKAEVNFSEIGGGTELTVITKASFVDAYIAEYDADVVIVSNIRAGNAGEVTYDGTTLQPASSQTQTISGSTVICYLQTYVVNDVKQGKAFNSKGLATYTYIKK